MRTIQAQFAGLCPVCRQAIAPGQRIVVGAAPRALHEACFVAGEPTLRTAEQAAVVAERRAAMTARREPATVGEAIERGVLLDVDPPRRRRSGGDEADEALCVHGVAIWKAGDCDRCEAEAFGASLALWREERRAAGLEAYGIPADLQAHPGREPWEALRRAAEALPPDEAELNRLFAEAEGAQERKGFESDPDSRRFRAHELRGGGLSG
jgi:hypothetical protein